MSVIHCEIYGQGPAVVMLHGWGMHSGVWRPFAEDLSKHYQVICLDLPGHGFSGGIDDYSLDSIAQALLTAISVKQFSLLGWSLGGSVAIRMAGIAPERVQQLLLLAANPKFVADAHWPGVAAPVLEDFICQLRNDSQRTWQRFLALQTRGSAQVKALLTELKHALATGPQPLETALCAGLKLLNDCDLRAELAQLRCPIQVLQGDQDPLIPWSTATALQDLSAKLHIHRLAQAGHLPFLSHPTDLMAQLQTLL